jgi:outer membrane protein assembly factor BamB
VSPTYADGMLYVTSDQRGIYVMNASDGAKLGWFAMSSNSWSSATIYEGKVYVGSNDWNVYCISDNPRLISNVAFDLSKSQILLGNSVNGSGFLIPGKPDANVSIYFVNPDGAVDDVQVVTAKRGAFNFKYTPSTKGNWTVTAVWDSDKDYWESAYSSHTGLEVVAPEPPPDDKKVVTWPPIEYYYVFAIAIVAAVIVATVVVLKKRRK